MAEYYYIKKKLGKDYLVIKKALDTQHELNEVAIRKINNVLIALDNFIETTLNQYNATESLNLLQQIRDAKNNGKRQEDIDKLKEQFKESLTKLSATEQRNIGLIKKRFQQGLDQISELEENNTQIEQLCTDFDKTTTMIQEKDYLLIKKTLDTQHKLNDVAIKKINNTLITIDNFLETKLNQYNATESLDLLQQIKNAKNNGEKQEEIDELIKQFNESLTKLSATEQRNIGLIKKRFQHGLDQTSELKGNNAKIERLCAEFDQSETIIQEKDDQHFTDNELDKNSVSDDNKTKQETDEDTIEVVTVPNTEELTQMMTKLSGNNYAKTVQTSDTQTLDNTGKTKNKEPKINSLNDGYKIDVQKVQDTDILSQIKAKVEMNQTVSDTVEKTPIEMMIEKLGKTKSKEEPSGELAEKILEVVQSFPSDQIFTEVEEPEQAEILPIYFEELTEDAEEEKIDEIIKETTESISRDVTKILEEQATTEVSSEVVNKTDGRPISELIKDTIKIVNGVIKSTSKARKPIKSSLNVDYDAIKNLPAEKRGFIYKKLMFDMVNRAGRAGEDCIIVAINNVEYKINKEAEEDFKYCFELYENSRIEDKDKKEKARQKAIEESELKTRQQAIEEAVQKAKQKSIDEVAQQEILVDKEKVQAEINEITTTIDE